MQEIPQMIVALSKDGKCSLLPLVQKLGSCHFEWVIAKGGADPRLAPKETILQAPNPMQITQNWSGICFKYRICYHPSPIIGTEIKKETRL